MARKPRTNRRTKLFQMGAILQTKRNPSVSVHTVTDSEAEWIGNARCMFSRFGQIYAIGAVSTGTPVDEELADLIFEEQRSLLEDYYKDAKAGNDDGLQRGWPKCQIVKEMAGLI